MSESAKAKNIHPPTDEEEPTSVSEVNQMVSKDDSRTVTPIFTSFSDTLRPSEFDESEMKEVELDDSNGCEDFDNKSADRYESRIKSQTDLPATEGKSQYTNRTSDVPDSSKKMEVVETQDSTDLSTRNVAVSDGELPSQFQRTIVIHSTDETPDETFDRLKNGLLAGTISHKDVIDSMFNVLVGGPFDLESRFIIERADNIEKMFELMDICPSHVQAEIWSVFVAIVRKSFRNLEACSQVGLISKCLERLPNVDAVISDLIIQLLGVLANYSITVKEIKHFLRALQANNGVWTRNSVKLLSVMQEMPKRDGADVFFSFPGKASAGIALPPLSRWPYQNGWTFSTWFRMDPLNSVNFEKEKPYLFSFTTAKGLGYFCYFMGNCLVLRCSRGPGKETTRCIKQELMPRKWHHVAISYNYSRWAKSEIQCFIDGQLVEVIEGTWLVSTADYFDRCFVGCGSTDDPNEAFCGQMAAIYVFSQSLTVQQATCLYCIGAAYQSQFKHDAESNLPEGYKKHLFDGRLNAALVFAYCPKNCHGQLCLFQQSTSPSTKTTTSHFVQIPHAIMKNGIEVVTTHSIHNSLHSVGGIQMLLPLFAQIDMPHQDGDQPSVDYEICSTMLSVISLLLNTSASAQQQLFHSQGFSIIAHVLNNSAREHLTMRVLEAFIGISKFLLNCPSGVPLLKQLFDHIFFCPQLWIRADSAIQIRVYNFLANDFFSNPAFLPLVRRTQTVVCLMHTLKVYYWIVPPHSSSNYTVIDFEGRSRLLERSSIVHIRTCILQLVEKLIFSLPADSEEKEISRDDEFQAIFHFISTVHEDDNLYDVLTQTMAQLCEHPAIMVPAFDRKRAICVIFQLVSSGNELIRIPALKTLGYYLCRSTVKRKNESLNQLNLFHLLTEKLLLNNRCLSLATYNALYEILVEQICSEILFVKHEDSPLDATRFENPAILKVIAQLLVQSEESAELIRVKKFFLQDLLRLCRESRDNRRTILQMSVWQEWLISLAYIYPTDEDQAEVSELIYQLFAVLLFHAIRLEYGGWRVWVDTMAITHSKVSLQKHRQNLMDREQREVNREKGFVKEDSAATGAVEKDQPSEQQLQIGNMASDETKLGSADQPTMLYRTPEFVWSSVHIRLLRDLLQSIESVVEEWNDSSVPMVDHLSTSDNQVFVSNTVHVLSQLTDSLVMACGGLLPLLAAATAPNSELDIADSTQQDLSIVDAVEFLTRFVDLADIFVFVSGVNFGELEQEKNMPSGGILRQSLRLVSTMAVRNILACRIAQHDRGGFSENSAKLDAIRRFVAGAMDSSRDAAKGIQDPDRLLQSIDLQRLKGVIYRDMEENRQAQFLALAVVYFLSVLMVSRYRDILEPPATPSPFFDTNTNGRKTSVVSMNSPPLTNTKTSPKTTSKTSINHIKASSEETNDNNQEEMDGKSTPEATINGDEQDKTKKRSSEGSVRNGLNGGENSEVKDDEEDNGDDEERNNVGPISSIQFQQEDHKQSEAVAPTVGEHYDTTQLARFNAANIGSESARHAEAGERREYLTNKLQKALESVAPLLREIMTDFKAFLQKTLLGTHGQEIMNDTKVMQSLKNPQGSVVELVMLLCSQEWQTSLQKHAGLAFIELVNEGRLMAHATRDHILRVANEADFILNRLRAEDVSKHAQFQNTASEQLMNRRNEDQLSDQLITSSRRRDFLVAGKMLEKMRTILLSPSGAWSTEESQRQIFWKIDLWEDDSRRRKRFIPNIYGRRHTIAAKESKPVANNMTDEVDTEKAHDQLLKELGHKMKNLSGQPKQQVTELVDESDIEKWANDENDLREPRPEQASYSTFAKLIAPGVVVPGTLSLTATDAYFDADEEHPLYKKQDPRSLRYCDYLHARWHFQEIRAIFLRRYMLHYTALELFLASRTAVMFAFEDQETVKKVVEQLPRVGVGVKYGLPQSRKTSLMSPRQLFKHSDMPQKWQRREISNFDYLMFLNTIAGRTYNDLNQYPVFPWILSNYTSQKLDLSEASNFRDLSKPIGALSESRRKRFQERYVGWDDESVPPFHYGTHYSTQAFTLNWMFRVEPFTTFFLDLQSGKFDHSDRLFHSLAETWDHCQRDSHDVKELIPELFYLPEMFSNANDYELGTRADGSRVGDVMLPPWADSSAEQFITVHRQALESDLVSCQLNQWIDLVFGYKQRGPEAVRAINVFYHLTYEGSVNLNAVENAQLREGIEQQILNFGQTPVQLLTEPHPPRHSIMTMSPLIFQPCHDDLCMLMKFISNSPIVHISANTYPQLQEPTVLSIAQNLVFALNRWNSNYSHASTQPASALSASLSSASNTGDKASNSGDPSAISTSELPLTVDPLLAIGNPSQPPQRRHLGDAFDQRLPISSKNFVCTVDSKFIVACGYPDYSFRLIETDNATVRQVVYGHGDVVTCLARSETSLFSDCYIASGSLDCTVVLWHFSSQNQAIAGEYNLPGESPSPRAILTGHDAEITAICVSAEHGIVISGSKDGTVLMHTTQSDLLRHIVCADLAVDGSGHLPPVTSILLSRDCYMAIVYGEEYLATFTTTGKQLNHPTHKSQEKIFCAVLSRDGEYIVLGTDQGRISILRLFPLQLLYTFAQTDSPTRCVAIASSQRLIFGGLDSGAIVVFNVDFNKWHYEYRQRYNQR